MLSKTKDESVKSFMEVLEKFTVDLDVAMINLQDSVQLAPCTIDLEAYKKPSEYGNAAHDPEVTSGLESIFNSVCSDNSIRPCRGMVQANRASFS